MSASQWGVILGVGVLAIVLGFVVGVWRLAAARRWRALALTLLVLGIALVAGGYAAYRCGYYEAMRGGIAESNGDLDEALEWFGRAYDRNPGAFMVAYDIACCHARRGDDERCLQWLRRALDSSYGDFAREQARDDEDFESVRDDARFRELVGPGPD